MSISDWSSDVCSSDLIKGTDNKDQVLGNLERYWRYNALDTRNTLFITWLLIQLMKLSPQMQRNYNDTFMRNLSAISMSMKGVKADFKKLEEHRTQLQSEVDKNLERFRFMIADPDFNVNSPAQKLDLIYGVLGFRPRIARVRHDRKSTRLNSSH